MNLEELFRQIGDFSKETHGSSNYDKEELFVMGSSEKEFAPLKYLAKNLPELQEISELLKRGFVCDSYDLYSIPNFQEWYEKQFSKKLVRKQSKRIVVVYLPDNKSILEAIESVNKGYEVFRDQHILLNGKNLPVQLGEWYAKCILGLRQVKSTSQRGFDFILESKRIEVKVHWNDQSSPKGVKIKKSLVELSDYCVIIYLAQNLMIREICFLDSEFVLRKFADKGHTIFLKDNDISMYFFSKSNKHQDKIANSNALLKYATPTFAMKLAERF
jgi:hypothetical protein